MLHKKITKIRHLDRICYNFVIKHILASRQSVTTCKGQIHSEKSAEPRKNVVERWMRKAKSLSLLEEI